VLQKEWLKKKQPLPFDMVVFDEISKMKHSTAKRGRAFCKILPYFHYRVGLTGTPATNGLIDLHGQFLIVDGGFRLGPNITGYRERWFTLNQYSRRYVPRMGAMKAIEERIYDITLEMSQEQYLPELPPLVDVDRLLTLPDEVMEKYLEFEEEFFIEIGEDEVEAFNAAAKSMKCRQLANGAVYTSEDRSQWTLFHDEKLDMLEEIVEELNGEPLLIGYQFKHDAARIKERFPDAVFLDSKNVAEKVKLWNDGKIKILAGHPASMGHGLNLQHGGHHICWFGLPWALELYQQLIGRLLRNGQKGSKIFNHRLIAKGTVEEIMATVVKQKDATQKTLRDAVKRYRETKGA
jgi:SNF2 family DNA or RNA helicase